jgi:hypothetical protein
MLENETPTKIQKYNMLITPHLGRINDKCTGQ